MLESKKTIVIIGGGFSGCAFALSALSHLNCRIIMIENAKELGRGLAYQTPFSPHRLNVMAAKMSVYEDQPNHFVEWLWRQRKKEGNLLNDHLTSLENRFISRYEYGNYLHEEIMKHEGKFEWIQERALSWKEMKKNNEFSYFEISLSNQQKIHADLLIIATGYAPPKTPAPLKDIIHSPRFIQDPWTQTLPPALKQVLIIGTGLTMVDQALKILNQYPQAEISAISRHGYSYQMHSPDEINLDAEKLHLIGFSARRTFREVRNQINHYGKKHWRPVIDEVRAQAQGIWQGWSESEKKRFLRHIRPIWDTYRHRVAPEIYQKLSQYHDSGKLKTFAGKITDSTLEPLSVKLKERHTQKLLEFKPDVILNCTGASLDRSFFHSEIWSQDELDLGVPTNEFGNPLKKDQTIQNHVYVLGPVLKTKFWEIIAVPEIRAQVKKIIKKIANQ